MDSPKPNETGNPQVIFSWTAPIRPYKKRSSTVLRFYLALTLLLSLIIYFFQDRVLLVPVWALMFLFYILTITPPLDVENKITKFGVETAQTSARWEYLASFYFTKRFDFYILTLVGNPPYYFYLYMVVPSLELKNKLTNILSEHLVYLEYPKKGFTEKAIDFMSSLIPDDPPSASESRNSQEQAKQAPLDEEARPQAVSHVPQSSLST